MSWTIRIQPTFSHPLYLKYTVMSLVTVTLEGGLDRRLDLLTTYKSQLQIFITLSYFHALQFTAARAKPFQSALSSAVFPW